METMYLIFCYIILEGIYVDLLIKIEKLRGFSPLAKIELY